MSKEQRRMLNKICFKGNLSRMRYAIQQLDRFNEIRKAAMDAVLKNLHAIQADGAEVLGEEPKPNSWYMLDDEIAMFTPVCRQCGKQFSLPFLGKITISMRRVHWYKTLFRICLQTIER